MTVANTYRWTFYRDWLTSLGNCPTTTAEKKFFRGVTNFPQMSSPLNAASPAQYRRAKHRGYGGTEHTSYYAFATLPLPRKSRTHRFLALTPRARPEPRYAVLSTPRAHVCSDDRLVHLEQASELDPAIM